uniref:Integrase catalytic domain-containing protein n=1 Tax=Fagus sylvatica TaxID=28930 RepID=A0A2N9J9Y4_FAGSY
MAESNSTANTFQIPNISPLISIKLDGTNYLQWTSQFLPILRSYDLLSIVDGSELCPTKHTTIAEDKQVVNPAYVLWNKKDQLVLSWLIATLTSNVLSTVYGLNTSRQVWISLAARYASQSKSRITHLKRQLQTMRQDSRSCTDYLQLAKSWADQLAAVGKPVDEEDLISFIISGLNPSFNVFITTFNLTTRESPLPYADFESELLNHESLLANQISNTTTESPTFALYSNKPPNQNNKPRFSSHSKPNGPPRYNRPPPISRNHSPPFSHQKPSTNVQKYKPPPPPFNSSRPPCQICGKLSHQALDCYHRMDYSYQGRHPPTQLAAMVAHTNSQFPEDEQPWYADSGANQHITADLENLNISQEPYQGNADVAVGNGSTLQIANTGSTSLTAHNSTFKLNHVLHCPNVPINLLSIQKFCADNNCLFELTASSFVVKDIRTGQALLHGHSRDGLYPIPLHRFPSPKTSGLTAYLGLQTSTHIWHHRLGHPAMPIVQRILNNHKLPTTNSSDKFSFCEPCQLAKSKRLPFPKSTRKSLLPLQLIHSDVWQSPVISLSGFRYYVIFIDDYSRFSWLFPLKFKSDVHDCFLKFKCMVENLLSRPIKSFQSDGGGEYSYTPFKNLLAQHGILHRFSCPHTSQQNGVAERKHRHVVDTGLALLAHSGLSTQYWVEAFLTAIYLINRLPTPTLSNLTPYFKLFHRSPDYHLLRTFGCACYPLLRPYNKHKLNFRSKKCVFLGYSPHHRGYRCLDLSTHRVYISRDVVFNEQDFPAKTTVSLPVLAELANPSESVPISLPTPPGNSLTSTSHFPLLDIDTTTPDLPIPPSPPPETAPLSPTPTTNPPPNMPLIPAPPPISQHTTHRITRSMTGASRPKQFHDHHLYYSTLHPLKAFHATDLPPEPTTFSHASKIPEWKAAMDLEYQALITNGTWTLCPRPPNRKIIRNKWVYRLKQKADGSLDRHKARLVAKGFDQEDGIDYTETFSPVIKPTTIRVLLALAVHYDWSIHQLDVSNAFLHGSLLEEVFMEQPRGFVDALRPNHVCRLHKALYGLKQAPRAWFTRLRQSLVHLGFKESLVDASLFTFHHSDIHLYVLVYVDDILVTGTHSSHISTLIRTLQQEFPLKDLGALSYFLGIHVVRNSQGLHLSQSKYIVELLHRAHMIGAKPCSTPTASSSKLSLHDGVSLSEATEYRQIVGALQYCTLTRPDIAFSVNQLCQFMHSPTNTHWAAAKRVLRYLKGTIDHGLFFSKSSLHLHAFCDSDWAGGPDDRRSTTGFGIFLGSCLVSWSAKKQSVVARSSTEAEYRAMAITTADLYWIRMLLKDLHVPLSSPPVLWCDNAGALALASNPVFHARTKHIEIDYHFIREKVVNRDMSLRFISTGDQRADIFTKGLPTPRFQLLRDKLLVSSCPVSLRGAVKEISLQHTQSDSLPSIAHTTHQQLPSIAHTAHQQLKSKGISLQHTQSDSLPSIAHTTHQQLPSIAHTAKVKRQT